MIQLGVLGSTRGTNLLTLMQAITDGVLPARIEIVISDKPNALILERAQAKGIHTQFLNPLGLSRSDFDLKITEQLKKAKVDLVILIGYMRILSTEFVQEWADRVMNVHPSLLPAFAGKMDKSLHQLVLDSGLTETGCTVHYVTAEVDAGPILVQKKCPVLADDTVDSLKARVQGLEGMALIEAIQGFRNI